MAKPKKRYKVWIRNVTSRNGEHTFAASKWDAIGNVLARNGVKPVSHAITELREDAKAGVFKYKCVPDPVIPQAQKEVQGELFK